MFRLGYMSISSIFFIFSAWACQSEWDYKKACDYLQKSWTDHGYQAQISSSKNMEINNRKGYPEVFSTIIIFEILDDLSAELKEKAITYIKKNITNQEPIYFFENHSLLPADVDCTALGFAFLNREGAIEKNYTDKLVHEIASNATQDGIIKVYFDNKERKDIVDAVVCSNALYAIYNVNSPVNTSKTEDFIYKMLVLEEYRDGTRYYPSPDAFLWSVSRLLKFNSLEKRFLTILREKILKRIGVTSNPLDLAFRVIASKNSGICNIEEEKKLAALQHIDGSWASYAFFKYGKSAEYFGSSQITTAFALCALNLKNKQPSIISKL